MRLDRQYEIVLDKVLAQHEAFAKKLNTDAQSNFSSGILLLVVFGVLFLAIIVAILVFVRRYILSPLDHAKAHCSQIAAGILDKPVPVNTGSKSEIQQLMTSMESMRTALTGIITRVRQATQAVSFASQEIASGNVDLNNCSE